MGKSPTGTTDSTEDDTEEADPGVPPDQTDLDEYDTPEANKSEQAPIPTPPADGRDGASSGGGPDVAPVTPDGEETDALEGDGPDDEPEEETPDTGNPKEDPEPEEPEEHDESENAEDEDEEKEPEQNEAKITVYTDPWDVTGWDNEPDLRRLQETFGDKLAVEYDYLPARTVKEWESDTKMPTVDDPDLPESTRDSYRALTAAQEQDLAHEYFRRLQIAALSEGRDIESNDVLVELAEEIGLDADRLREDMAHVEVEDLEPVEETPQMDVTIADIPHYWTGNIEFGRVSARMVGEGVQPELTGRSIPEFVTEYEPVATAEVAKTFDLDRDQATEELQQQENVIPRDFGAGTFWFVI